ncbi:DUF4091 domain-containing protein [bacterium]|nr:DUF4091 domain-containing protein [bacterium]
MSITCWLQGPYQKIYPTGNMPDRRIIELDAVRGERISFQAGVTNFTDKSVITVRVIVKPPKGIALRVRRVGFVPLVHHNTDVPDEELDCKGHVPGYVPDPLFDEDQAQIAKRETGAFWFTVKVEKDCCPGRKSIVIAIEVDGRIVKKLTAQLVVYNVVLQKRKGFPVFQWFYNDALLDWYKLKPFEEKFWQIVRPYMLDLSEHEQDTIYVPIFTPPLDGVKTPSQLVKIKIKSKGKYEFGFKDVKRYVDLARKCGIKNFEWTHFFSQWGSEYAIRVYEGQGIGEKLLWKPKTPATSQVYRNFLAQFLPQFKKFLDRESILKNSFFHVSDEPHGDDHLKNYKKARAMLKDLAPWIKTMDALSEIVYGREKITDMPVPSIKVTKQFIEEGIPCFTYFCCVPRGFYLNRLMDTPLIKIRMSGWLFYKFRVLGFLHWGYNYWYKRQTRQLIDPFTEQSAKAWPEWAYGDPFLVYLGPAGPIDSIRWEIFAESLQDYALLQTLGIDPDCKMLEVFKDFDKFPKSEKWFKQARKKLVVESLNCRGVSNIK